MSNERKIQEYKTLKLLINRIRDDLNNSNFVLIYAYNGTGKTRLSMEFKEKGKKSDTRDTLYFNAFTEDLFTWNNDLEEDTNRHIIINEKSKFFEGFKELSLEKRIYFYLDRYTNIRFSIDYDKWTISFSKNDNSNIKISRGEENIFIWCIYLSICELAIDGDETYDWVKYFYIDDPISSLDENNAIAVASDLAKLLKKGKEKIKTVISSHHGLFFNVLFNELKNDASKKYFLYRDKITDVYMLQATDDTPFFNHVAILSELQKAMESDKIYTYHFNMLRSVLEKTAIFFGSDTFSYCIHGLEDEVLYARAINLLSHGNYSIYEPIEMVSDTKALFKKILSEFLNRYEFVLPEIFKKETTPSKGREVQNNE